MGQLCPSLAGNVHNVNVLSTRRARTIFTVPGKGKKLSIWRPGGGGSVSAISHALHICPVSIHDVNLGQPSAPTDPGNLCVCLWVPYWRYVRSSECSNTV